MVTDRNVGGLYGEKITALLGGKDVCYVEIESGEEHKSMNTVADILEKLAENKLTRSDLIVALGGGIVGDVAGFAAACYLRGVDFVQVPTTLLAMVDSSVGGKTGVNLSAGKTWRGRFTSRGLWCATRIFSPRCRKKNSKTAWAKSSNTAA